MVEHAVCDVAGAGAAVKVAYPARGARRGPYSDIVGRGNVPLLIGDCLLAELPRERLDSEWSNADRLSDAEMARCCRGAAERLARAFESEIAAADLPDLVADAAVLFLLSLKRNGLDSPRGIGPCTVTYDGSAATGAVRGC